jgi:hypothetical protein
VTQLEPKRRRFAGRPAFRDRRLQRLAAHLPRGLRSMIHGLRRPSARWVRLPAGLMFLVGGTILTPLPVFGFWMLPVGLVLVAEDIPFARNCVARILDTIERRKPEWLRRRRS